MTKYESLLQAFGYRATQGFGKTTFALNSGIYPNNFHDGRDYTYRRWEYRNCKLLVPGQIIYTGSRSRFGRGYGLVVETKVSDSVILAYCHLDRAFQLATPGTNRKAGDDIGIIGSSGQSTGPHVHLLARVNGSPADPRDVINAYYAPRPGQNNQIKFSGAQLLTRIGENYEILMRYSNLFLSHKYRYVEGDHHWNGQHFRKFVFWWAENATKEQFQKAIEADFQTWKRENR